MLRRVSTSNVAETAKLTFQTGKAIPGIPSVPSLPSVTAIPWLNWQTWQIYMVIYLRLVGRDKGFNFSSWDSLSLSLCGCCRLINHYMYRCHFGERFDRSFVCSILLHGSGSNGELGQWSTRRWSPCPRSRLMGLRLRSFFSGGGGSQGRGVACTSKLRPLVTPNLDRLKLQMLIVGFMENVFFAVYLPSSCPHHKMFLSACCTRRVGSVVLSSPSPPLMRGCWPRS